MKKLLIIRHAKSSWDISVQKDFDRPLNDRGHRDAPDMAKRLLKKEIAIDKFVSSPAKRAYTTAEYFADAYDIKHKHIIKVPELYDASVRTFYQVVEALDDDLKTVVLFSHNPSITEFANELTETHIDNMPTCAVFAVKCDIKHWSEFSKAEKEFWFFDYPKS